MIPEYVAGRPRGAIGDGARRLLLWRVWVPTKPLMLYVMLNPSTADGRVDDPTIRRCEGFSAREKAGGFFVVNLLSQRTTYPSDLRFEPEPERADEIIRDAFAACEKLVVAWGSCSNVASRARPLLAARERFIIETAGERELLCLGETKLGFPVHPLRLPMNTPLRPWNWGTLPKEPA